MTVNGTDELMTVNGKTKTKTFKKHFTERKILRELRRELKMRQHYLIASLHSTYPIFTAGDGITRTICGLALPSPSALNGGDRTLQSSALNPQPYDHALKPLALNPTPYDHALNLQH